jgi:hypothetical protein
MNHLRVTKAINMGVPVNKYDALVDNLADLDETAIDAAFAQMASDQRDSVVITSQFASSDWDAFQTGLVRP